MTITTTQQDTKDDIVEYGRENGYSEDDIQYAVNAAFIESSLGDNTDNGVRYPSTNSTVPGHIEGNQQYIGTFQYNHDTWVRHASLGDITDPNAQIAAIYSDINKFTLRYEALSDEQKTQLTREEYMYSKHHGGNNYIRSGFILL